MALLLAVGGVISEYAEGVAVVLVPVVVVLLLVIVGFACARLQRSADA